MKNLNTAHKFKLNKTIVTRFTKPGTLQGAAPISSSVIQTVTSIIGDTFM